MKRSFVSAAPSDRKTALSIMDVRRSRALAVCCDIFQISFLQLAHRLQETQEEYDYHITHQLMDLPKLDDIFDQSPNKQQVSSSLGTLQHVWKARARVEMIRYEMRELSFLLSVLEGLRYR